MAFDDTNACSELEERIVQIQRDERCVKRAARVMTLVAALAAVGFAYGVVFQDRSSYGKFLFVLKIFFEVGVASLISLAFFAGLLMEYRKKLNRLREECRQLVTKLLDSRLGTPDITPSPGVRLAAGDREIARDAVPLSAIYSLRVNPQTGQGDAGQ